MLRPFQDPNEQSTEYETQLTDEIYGITTSAPDTLYTVAVPSGAGLALFNATVDYWVAYNGTTAAVPPSAGGQASAELNPNLRSMNGVTELSILVKDPGSFVVTFYK